MTATLQNTNPVSDNVISKISRVAPITETSKKTGNPYHALDIYWNQPSGSQYRQRVFLNDEQYQLIENAVPLPGSNALDPTGTLPTQS